MTSTSRWLVIPALAATAFTVGIGSSNVALANSDHQVASQLRHGERSLQALAATPQLHPSEQVWPQANGRVGTQAAARTIATGDTRTRTVRDLSAKRAVAFAKTDMAAARTNIRMAQAALPDQAATTGDELPTDAPPPDGIRSHAGDMPVLYITGIELLHPVLGPKSVIVRVTGLAASTGWGPPQLVPTGYRDPSDGVLDLELIATAPDESQMATGFFPVSAILALEPGDHYRGVRVRATANAAEIGADETAKSAEVHGNDCADCVGKKLVVTGQAAPAGNGFIRQEDLPAGSRILTPTSGMGLGATDPNRLTLIVAADGTIVEAFWE